MGSMPHWFAKTKEMAAVDRYFSTTDVDAEGHGVRGVVLSWNCVAPAGEDFFEVDALRGPTVVEFAIATPRPFGHATVMGMADDLRAGLLAFGPNES